MQTRLEDFEHVSHTDFLDPEIVYWGVAVWLRGVIPKLLDDEDMAWFKTTVVKALENSKDGRSAMVALQSQLLEQEDQGVGVAGS